MWPPEVQFFQHLRNGCFHGNRFDIWPNKIDPSNPPAWHTYVIPTEADVNGQKVINGFFRLPHFLPFLYDMGAFA